jgi:hypothetical protein
MKVIAPASRLHEAFYAMGLMSRIPGGPHHIYFPLREPAARDHFTSLQALASRMPWIRSVSRGLPPLMQFGLDLRPYQKKQDGRSMLAKMSYYCGLYELQPWFERMSSTAPHVVVSRTLVQQNPLFPWGAILSALRGFPILFVGAPDEHEAFLPLIPEGVVVEYRPLDWGGATLDACLSASLYVGNHSPALAIVEGAHVPAITEVSLSNPDNIYLRQESKPSFSNRADFPPSVPTLGGYGVEAPITGMMSAIYTDWPPPPGGWRTTPPGRGTRRFNTLDDACFHLCRYTPDLTMMNREYARRRVLEENFENSPEWADEAIAHRLFKKPTLALRATARKIKLRKFLPSLSSYLSDLCD